MELRGKKKELVLAMLKPNPYNPKEPNVFRVTHLSKLVGIKKATVNEYLRDLNDLGIVKLRESSGIQSTSFKLYRRILGATLVRRNVKHVVEYKIKEETVKQLIPLIPSLCFMVLIYMLGLDLTVYPLLVSIAFTSSYLVKLLFDLRKVPKIHHVYIRVRKSNKEKK